MNPSQNQQERLEPLVSPSAQKKLIEWLVAQDGMNAAAKTMVAVALGVQPTPYVSRGILRNVPNDAHEFVPCYDLVKKVPELRQAFSAIAKFTPTFARILTNWDGLCSIYEAEGPSATLHYKIKDFRGDTPQLVLDNLLLVALNTRNAVEQTQTETVRRKMSP